MQRIYIKSSNLNTVGYDTISKVLEIEFKSGSVYQYFNVPVEIYEQLISASSAGRYFNRYIAYNFKYRLLDNHSYSEYSTQRDSIEHPPSPIEIKSLYHKLVMRFHPDRIPGYEQLMKEIITLYKERNYRGLQIIALKYSII